VGKICVVVCAVFASLTHPYLLCFNLIIVVGLAKEARIMTWKSLTSTFGDRKMRELERLPINRLAQQIIETTPLRALRMLAEIMLHGDTYRLAAVLKVQEVWNRWQKYKESANVSESDHQYAKILRKFKRNYIAPWKSKTGHFNDGQMLIIQHSPGGTLAQTLVGKDPLLVLRVLAEIMLNGNKDKLAALLKDPQVRWRDYESVNEGITSADYKYAKRLQAAMPR
jgi:hypothetical protein